jgi:hypothetical protein
MYRLGNVPRLYTSYKSAAYIDTTDDGGSDTETEAEKDQFAEGGNLENDDELEEGQDGLDKEAEHENGDGLLEEDGKEDESMDEDGKEDELMDEDGKEDELMGEDSSAAQEE